MKLERAQQQLEDRLEPGERVLSSSLGVPLVNAASLTSADFTGGGCRLRRELGLVKD